MRSFTLLLLIWAVTCASSAYVANVLSPMFVVAIVLLAIAQWLIGGLPQLLRSRTIQHRSSTNGGVLFVESTVALSMVIVLSALVSSWAGAAACALYVGLRTVAVSWPRVATQASAVDEPADPYLLMVASIGAVAGLYLALPALRAAAIGYQSYDAAIWIDAPFHASYVAAFANALAAGHYNDIHGAGLPIQFYHWAGYAMPAAIKAISGVAALPLVQMCTVWVSIALSVALYELAKRFTTCDKVAALAALLVLVVPDFGLSALGHPVFGFHWLLNVAFGNTIGVAIALTAFAVMVDGCRAMSVRQVLGAWLLGASVILFKGQIFVLISAPLFLCPSLMWPGLRPIWRSAILFVGAVVVALATWVTSFSNALPLIRIDFSGVLLLLATLTAAAPPWIVESIHTLRSVTAIPNALTLLVVFAGILFLPWLVLLLGATVIGRTGSSKNVAWPRLLLVLAMGYVFAAIALSPDDRMATGGPFEIQLQGQIWGYACFALACSIYIGEALLKRWGTQTFTPIGVLACLSLIVLVPVQRSIQRVANIGIPSLAFGPTNFDIEQLQRIAPHCGLMLVADGDPLLVWQAAMERPAWVVNYALNPKQRPEVTTRWSAAKASGDNAVAWLGAQGISIYLEPKRGTTTVSELKIGHQPDAESASYRVWFIAPTDVSCAAHNTKR